MPKTNDLLKMTPASILHGITKRYAKQHTVKVLSLTQPWATLLVLGFKRVETRSWYPNHVEIESLWIHASKGASTFGLRYLREMCQTWPFRQCLAEAGYNGFDELPRGQMLGRGTLAGYRTLNERQTLDYNNQPISEHEYAFGDYAVGRRGWLFDSMEKLETPIPAKGALQLWDWVVPEEAVLVPSWSLEKQIEIPF